MSEFSARRDENEGYEARDDEEQDKTRRHKWPRLATPTRSAGRFQDFYGQEEGVSELFGKFMRGSL